MVLELVPPIYLWYNITTNKKGRKSPMAAKGWQGYRRNDDLVKIKQNLSSLDSKAKGTITESYVCAKLTELGFEIWLPYMNNHKCDLAIFQNGKTIRIQVKTATFDPSRERFRAILTTRDKTGKHIVYCEKDIDFFIIKCEGIPVFYVIPISVGIKHSSLNLYPQREKLWSRSFDAEQYKEAFSLIE